MEQHPSPATVARHYLPQIREPGEAASLLRKQFPRLAEEVRRLDQDFDQELSTWENVAGAVAVGDLASPQTSSFRIASGIRDVVRRKGLPLIAYLTAEAILSDNASAVAGYMRSAGATLEEVLVQLHERLGEAFLDTAFQVGWQRRAVFGRALESARAYLDWTRKSELLRGYAPRRGIQTRIGIASVLAARFGPVDEFELREACRMLLESHLQGAENAMDYFVEASIWLSDLFGDDDALRNAAMKLREVGRPDSGGTIMAIHLWLRLAGIGSRPHGVQGFIDRGRERLARYSWVTNRPDDAALVLLSAAFDQIENDARMGFRDISTRGILFPFGHRRPDTPVAPLFERGLNRFITALRESALAGDFVFRDLEAEFQSRLARLSSTARDDAISLLRGAIAARAGNGRTRPVNRAGVEVDMAADRFLLADLTGSLEMRRQGLLDLLRAAQQDTMKPRYLTMIAKEIEDHGRLVAPFVGSDPELALAIREGNATAIFEAAAHAAYQDADLAQVLLGGRGDVETLRDSDGVSGQTFVYKRTTPEAKARDEQYSSAVAAELASRGLGARFGLIEHVTQIGDVSGEGDHRSLVVSVRRFASGVPLRNYLRTLEPGHAMATLVQVAEFLAIIHFAGINFADSDGMRSGIKERELGRWLRALRIADDERLAIFNKWWGIVGTAPITPRRDAHDLNWLIDADGVIRAVDLESKGARPFGYELAQLVEDGQVLPALDYELRNSVLQSYVTTWNEISGAKVALSDARCYYDAGVIARAVRAISSPSASPLERRNGGDLLASIAVNSGSNVVRELALDLGHHWNRIIGRVAAEDSKTISDAERRRISRAMSYHLRHDAEAPSTKSGWVHVDELAELLRASGHKVSSEQLLLIAGALGEPRFELEADEIRAAYGHTTKVQIAYDSKRPPRVLYHATPTRNLASIFEARSGLNPRERNWVHLSESCAVAVDAARRQQAAVSVLEVDSANVEGLVHASGITWLAPNVKVESLRVLPIRKVSDLVRHSTEGQ